MKIVLIFLIIFSNLSALEVDSKYKVTFGLFGTIGEAVASLKSDDKKYKITIEADSNGLARVLSDNRFEKYISEGTIQNGVFRPDIFRKIVTTNHSGDDSKFVFDYKNKKVVRYRERYKKYTDFFTKELVTEKTNDEKEMEYFANNDLLTLFFNLPFWSKELKNGESIQYAIGANDKDGKVNISELETSRIKETKNVLGEGQKYLSVVINQKIFASKNGELFIVLDSDNLSKKAILKDVLFFGDIIGEMVEKKITK